MSFRKKNTYQGLSHLMIIAFVPLLTIGAFFAESWIVKIILIVLLVFLAAFIWRKLV